jgi:hypothetical protein
MAHRAIHDPSGTAIHALVSAPFEGQLFLRTQLPAFLANAGLEWNSTHLALRPEIRYTRWQDAHGFHAVQNQVEISIGLSLRPQQ